MRADGVGINPQQSAGMPMLSLLLSFGSSCQLLFLYCSFLHVIVISDSICFLTSVVVD
jgi:hypothetical protein